MSQIIKNLAAGPVPPAVATSYVTDINSPSVPIANVENIIGGTVTTDNPNGIQTDGSSGSNIITNQLTNRITATATTTDAATPVSVYTFALGATPATYLFEIRVIAFNVTDNLSAGYSIDNIIRTTGAAGVSVSSNPGIISEEGAMSGIVLTFGVSGNNAILTVNGLAAKTIHWRALTTYIKVV